MLVVDDIYFDQVGHACSSVDVLNIDIVSSHSREYRGTRAGDVSINDQVLGVGFVVDGALDRLGSEITCSHSCSFCRCCVLVEVTTKFRYRSEQKHKDRHNYRDLYKLHSAIVTTKAI